MVVFDVDSQDSFGLGSEKRFGVIRPIALLNLKWRSGDASGVSVTGENWTKKGEVKARSRYITSDRGTRRHYIEEDSLRVKSPRETGTSLLRIIF